MAGEKEESELGDALISVWRQALLDGVRHVRLGDDTYPVRRTAKNKLAQVDFEVAGRQYEDWSRTRPQAPGGRKWRRKEQR